LKRPLRSLSRAGKVSAVFRLEEQRQETAEMRIEPRDFAENSRSVKTPVMRLADGAGQVQQNESR